MDLGKLIIIEGPDRTGKDTQINLLKKYFKKNEQTFLDLHFGKPPKLDKKDMIFVSKNMFKNTFDFMLKSIKLSQNFILNRFHIGEFVYASLYRKYSGNYIFSLEKNFQKKYQTEFKNIYLIIIIDTAQNLINREDGDSFSKTIEMKQKEIDRFILSFEKSFIENKIIINIENKSINQVYNEICDFLGI